MSRRILVLACLFIVSGMAHGQQSRLKVIVHTPNVGSQQVPGTLTIRSLPDSIIRSTAVIQDSLSLSLTTGKTYYLSLTAAGMQTYSQRFVMTDAVSPLIINWQASSKQLDAVVVTSRRPLLRQEDDKSIMDAEPIAASSANAFEIMEKIPGAVMDGDGNLYLNSATPAVIQINGREVKLSPTDLASLLKSLPSSSVIRIEILRSPSAKYDASGSGGIINIVLRKGVKLGTNGTVNAAYFQGKQHTATAGMNINRGMGKTNMHFSYQYADRNNQEDINSTRLTEPSKASVNQQARTIYHTPNHYLGAGIDIELKKQWTLGYEASLSLNNQDNRATTNVAILSASGQSISRNNSLINTASDNIYTGHTLSLAHKLDSSGSTWNSSVNFDGYRSETDQYYVYQFLAPSIHITEGKGATIGTRKNISFISDLALKTKKGYTIESGIKLSSLQSRNNADYLLNNGTGFKVDSFQTNTFRYRETIGAAYLQVSKTFAGFTIKPGLRAEHTDIKGHQLFPADTSLQIRRTDLFPYVYLRHSLIKLFGFTLVGNAVYRRSITRPYYEALNPYPRYIDQFLYEAGNPKLKPQFTTNYEFNIMADEFPVFSIGLNDIRDIFTGVTYSGMVDTMKVLFRTYDNLGKNKEYYMRLVGGIPPGGKYFFYAGMQYNQVNYDGFYENMPLKYTRNSYTFFTYHNYRPVPTLNLTLNGFMRTGGLQNFYELRSFGALNFSVNKAILKKKMNIILAANDIFHTNKYDFTLSQGTAASGTRVNDTRRFGLTVRYNFGIKPKEDKKPGFEAPAEVNN